VIDEILKKLNRKKLYIKLKPATLRKILEKARSVYGTYKTLYKSIGLSEPRFFEIKRKELTAISSDKLSALLNIVKLELAQDDIIEIKSRPSGYSLPAKLLFIENPFSILDEWDNYLLGAIASDGSVHNGHIYLRTTPYDVEFSAIQIYTLAKLAEKIHGKSVNISVGISKHKGFGQVQLMNSVSISSIMLTLFLQEVLKLKFGTNYSIPHWLYSNKSIFPWLAGLIDGDGCISTEGKTNKWYLEVDNGSLSPLIELKELLAKNIYPFRAEPRKEKLTNKFLLRTSNKEFFRHLFTSLLPFIIIERKRENIIKVLDSLNVKIRQEQRTTRNPIMDKVVGFLKERNLLTKLQNWEKLETYGKEL
jgi:hypothetical protein